MTGVAHKATESEFGATDAACTDARATRGYGESLIPLAQAFAHCRQESLRLVQGLSDADVSVQSMDDASPSKWHLAHTTWFFEEFVLSGHVPDYRPFHPRFRYLFNSYYDTVGERHPRPRRGLLTRPALDEVKAYRQYVDGAMAQLEWSASARTLIELGIHHEQQHQELLLTDLLHLFAQNPLRPVYRADARIATAEGDAGEGANPNGARHVNGANLMSTNPTGANAGPVPSPAATPLTWVAFPGGRVTVGHDGDGFAFDCETPRHDVLLRPYALASRPVTQGDWLDFMRAGGYDTPRWWLSDGWATARREGWRAPMYWIERDGAWSQMTLSGERALEPDAPVCHISCFEADAYARWAGARLPTEFEWEAAACMQVINGHFADRARYRPAGVAADTQRPLRQLFGDVWEWTASPYTPYPGFRTAEGAVGEYNGKFMSGQYVLRGGSCATPAGHVRATYRNFFYPHQRWQFMGLRLAKDLP